MNKENQTANKKKYSEALSDASVRFLGSYIKGHLFFIIYFLK